METTKVATVAQTSKFKVETHSFSVHDDSYKVIVYDETKPGESWAELVSISEIRSQVTEPDGTVDASFRNPFNQDTINNTISFDFYITYEFENEAKQILELIINKRKAAEKEAA